MPPISLLNLPVEIHSDILKHAFYSSQNPNTSCYRQGSPVKWEWIESDDRDISLFPYNAAAAVCQLWHDVLTQISECWTRVIIDVTTDPGRFLNIFLWSKDLPNLEVTVFNSHNPDSQDVEYSSLERDRVSEIVNALLPHTSRCKYITFDDAFTTSLPSPVVFLLEDAPHLYQLVLECKINSAGRVQDYIHACEFGVREPIQTQDPGSSRQSLSGFLRI